VIKSIRSMFTKDAGSLSEFGFDELVRETAQLLDRELAARKVSLELALDEKLPPIVANRVQMQRVLINILINAIESLGATRGRTRRIHIRSASPDEKSVQLEISDTGTGIAPHEIERIFEPFFSTKSRGTGLGLSLSRTIVEEHGGRLWASPGDKHGMTFFLKLPRSELLAA
jgi:signal transduction histidine kinase